MLMNDFQKNLTDKFDGFTNNQLIDIYGMSPSRIERALEGLSEAPTRMLHWVRRG